MRNLKEVVILHSDVYIDALAFDYSTREQDYNDTFEALQDKCNLILKGLGYNFGILQFQDHTFEADPGVLNTIIASCGDIYIIFTSSEDVFNEELKNASGDTIDAYDIRPICYAKYIVEEF